MNLLKREHLKILFFITLFLVMVGALFSLPRLAIPIGVAYIIYLVFRPLISILRKFRLNRNTSVSIVFGLFLFLSIFPVIKVVPTITQEAERLTSFLPRVESYLKKGYKEVKSHIETKLGFKLDEQEDFPIEILKISTNTSKVVLMSIPKYLGSLLEWTLVIPFFLFFMLKDDGQFRRFILGITPNSIFERFYNLYHQFNKNLGDYIFAKFIEATIIGVIITSGLLIIDLNFAFLFGLIAAITNIIPYVGPILGAIPAIVVAYAEFEFSSSFWAVGILYLVANTIDLAIVFPLLISKIVNLHPVVVVVSVILGSQLFGLIGMIISIPAAVAIKLLLQELISELYETRDY
ncbi:MAG: AI-2E family transporter [Bdellovibrionales bacterium]|jgi:putative permease|nr:AI-2E family transporter [Bdellovibrionales bacterium]